MARAIWSGYLSFGLVNVPVGLYSATSDQTIHFNQFHKGTSNRIRYKKVDEQSGEEVETADIVNGFDLGGGEYVVISREELKDAAPGKSEMIEISDFVDIDEIDPIHYRQSYYLGPRGKGADRAYALLRAAMHDSNKVGIATLVLRDKEHLVAIRPGNEALILETMYFADEIKAPAEVIDSLPGETELKARELEVAVQLINALTTKWEPERYENTYRARIEELIESKRQGKSIVFETERPRSNVIDLMSALEASLKTTVSDKAGAGSQNEQRAEPKAAPPARGEQQSFEGMSKAELLSRAAELDVAGRSKMSKLELVRALTAAEHDSEGVAEERPARRRRRAS